MKTHAAKSAILTDATKTFPSVSATQLKNTSGEVWDTVTTRGGVTITRHEKPKAVLISMERFEELLRAQSQPLEALEDEFDALLESMQGPVASKGMEKAFRASPGQLGKVAVSSNRKKRR